MKPFHVKVLTPSKPVLETQSLRVRVPASWGQMEIGASHAPFLSLLSSGALEVEEGSESARYFVSGGIVQVDSEGVTISTSVVETPDGIDAERAKQAELRAVERLSSTTNLDINIPRALASLKRARARLTLKV